MKIIYILLNCYKELKKAGKISMLFFQYLNGLRLLKKDKYQQAVAQFKKSAYKDYSRSQFRLGLLYEKGLGVSQDCKKAFYWTKKAAEQNYAYAQYNLARLYKKGLGVSQDYRRAFYWYKKAAEQNDAVAQANLWVMYYDGLGVAKDKAKAEKYLEQAVAAGLVSAKELLKNNFKE